MSNIMISKVALTGADDATHPADLMQICAQYPQVEWAILYGRPRMNTPRYPTESTIAELARSLRDGQDRFCLTKCTQVLQQVYGGT
jgi:hypothetical protein